MLPASGNNYNDHRHGHIEMGWRVENNVGDR